MEIGVLSLDERIGQTASSETGYCCLLYVSEEAMYQCTTYIGHTACIALNSSNSR